MRLIKMENALMTQNKHGGRYVRGLAPVTTIAAMGLALFVASASSARAGQMTLSASVDGYINDPTGTGAFTNLFTNLSGTQGLPIVNLFGVAYQDRSIVEFQNTLPTNALIQSVTLSFQDLGTSNNVHDVDVLAYLANGTITLADATTAATLVDTYVSVGSPSVRTESLNASAFQSLLGSGDYFALRFEGKEVDVNTGITSIEQGNFFPGLLIPPSLTINYTLQSVPEPSSLVLGCVSAVWLMGLIRGRRRREISRAAHGAAH
jgi:hypothetical protein